MVKVISICSYISIHSVRFCQRFVENFLFKPSTKIQAYQISLQIHWYVAYFLTCLKGFKGHDSEYGNVESFLC